MFTISYAIKPENRDQYLTLIREMKHHLTTVGRQDYSVFEAKSKKNQFTEVFIANSMEEFDSLEDNLDDKTHDLISTLEGFVDDSGMKYNTIVETI
jgi:L-rhamnose mutarotase